MAEAGFKHITVTAAEEEDEVVLAGAAAQPVPRPQTATPADTPSPEDAETPEDAAGGHVSTASAAPAKPAGQASPLKPARPSADYRQTTLDDLKGAPMPTAQKITIIAAVVCIIGAVAYYVAFML